VDKKLLTYLNAGENPFAINKLSRLFVRAKRGSSSDAISANLQPADGKYYVKEL
jgi:hypothetical protein